MPMPCSASASNFSRNRISRPGGSLDEKNSFGVGSKLMTIDGTPDSPAFASTRPSTCSWPACKPS